MAEIATAYVSLIPSASKLTKGIENDLGAAGDRGGVKAGTSFTSKLGGVLKKSVIGVGVAAGGVLAASMVKGWGRLTNIENATAKLTGLGNSAKDVDAIMKNALASVKGTAFGLDEAATTAASAVAAGIKPGKDLEGVLKTVADTATIAGKSMKDTGAIFGSVAARGKLQGDDLMQLQSAGVPVLAMLAKHYGVTAQAASQMVSKGQVDFKDFNAAMQENLGGAALKSGETTAGAFKNMGAAFSRLGAALVGPVFGGAKGFFNMITNAVDALTSKVGPAIGKITDWFKGLISTVSADGLSGIVDGMRAVAGGADMADAFDGVNATVAIALSKLVEFYQKAKGIFAGLGDAIKSAFSGDFSGLAEIGQRLVDGLVKVLPQLLTSGQMMIIRLIDGALDMLPKILDVASKVIEKLAGALVKLIPKLAAAAAPIISKLIDALSKALPQLLDVGVKAVATIIDGIVKVLPQLVTLAVQLVSKLASALIGALPTILQAAIQLVQALLTGIVQMLPQIVRAAIGLVQNLVSGLVQALPQIVQAAVQLVTGLITGIVSMLPQLIQSAIALVSALAGALIDSLPKLVDAGLQLLMGIVRGVLDNLPKLIDAAVKLVSSLIKQVVDMLPSIIDAGLQLLLGIVNGILDNLPTLIDAALALVMQLIDALLDNLPKIIDAGLQLLTGVIDGIIKNLPKIITAGLNVVLKLVDALIVAIPKLVDAALQIITALVDYFTNPANLLTLAKGALDIAVALVVALGKLGWKLAEGAVKMVSDLIGSIGDALNHAWSRIGQLGADLVSAIWSGIGDLVEMGKNIVLGIWNGILSLGSWLWDKVTGFFSGIWDGVKGVFGISSPSKKMAWAGQMMGVGLVQGLESMRGAVGAAADGLWSEVSPGSLVSPTFRPPDLSGVARRQSADLAASRSGSDAALLAAVRDVADRVAWLAGRFDATISDAQRRGLMFDTMAGTGVR